MTEEEEDYYSILGCEEEAPIEVIKKCYHEKALTFHPDKGGLDEKTATSFDKINKAWKTLSDPVERRIYDAKLNEQRLNGQNLLFGTFNLGEMVFDNEKNSFSYKCRCGGEFAVDRVDLNRNKHCDISVECDTCSLVINIKLD